MYEDQNKKYQILVFQNSFVVLETIKTEQHDIQDSSGRMSNLTQERDMKHLYITNLHDICCEKTPSDIDLRPGAEFIRKCSS